MSWRVALLLLLFAGCGPDGGETRVVNLNAPRQPRFALQGACAPSVNSTPRSLDGHETSCLRPLSAPTLIETAPDFEALFGTSCERPGVDFGTSRVLVVPARGASEWFVFPHFVMERPDALEVGLVIRPRGALPPDTLLVLPRSPEAVELRWCRSVCVENCDLPLP